MLKLSVVIVCFAALVAGALAATAPVGGPPTNSDIRCRPGQHCGEPIVVASSDATPLPVEMVAYTSRRGLCVGLDVDARQRGAICNVQRADRDAIENIGQTWNVDGGHKFTYTYGALRDDVAALDVTYRKRGSVHITSPVIAFIRGDLQERLGQAEPFTGFTVLARGCNPINRFRFTARDADGNVLQRVHLVGFAEPEAKPDCDLYPPVPVAPPTP